MRRLDAHARMDQINMTPFRILYNQDSSNLFFVTKEPLTPSHVDHMIDEVADGGADTFLVNPNAQRVNYPSRVWENYWHNFRPNDRAFYGLPEDMDIAPRRHLISQMQHLAQQCDYLERALARCRQRNIKPGVSVRMNDMHDVPWPESHLFSQFYRDHPQYYLPHIPARSWSSRGLNYEHPEVRTYFLTFIRELIFDYDIEVLELDFLRFTAYFDQHNIDQHCATMTAFLTDVRTLITQSGKPIEFLCRIAATPAGAYSLGFDVRAYQNIVDGLVIGMFLNTGWELAIDHYRTLVDPNIALYACTDYIAARWEGLPPEPLSTNANLLRGFASGYHALGANGIALFNFFCSREGQTPIDPAFNTLRDCQNTRHLNTQPRRHLLTAGVNQDETDLPVQIPIDIKWHQPRTFQMILSEPTPNQRVEVHIIINNIMEPSTLHLWINNTPIGHAVDLTNISNGEHKNHIARFVISKPCIQKGRNNLILRSEKEAITILGIDVQIGS